MYSIAIYEMGAAMPAALTKTMWGTAKKFTSYAQQTGLSRFGYAFQPLSIHIP